MNEKHKTPETFFDVDEISFRLNNAIASYNEGYEKFEKDLSTEDMDVQKSATETLEAIKTATPKISTKDEFTRKLDEAKEAGTLSDKAYRLIMSQTYY